MSREKILMTIIFVLGFWLLMLWTMYRRERYLRTRRESQEPTYKSMRNVAVLADARARPRRHRPF